MSDLEKCATTSSADPLGPDGVQEGIPSTTVCTNSGFPTSRVQSALTLLGAFVGLFCTFGLLSSFGTFQAWYGRHQLAQLSPSAISWVGSTQLCVFFLSGAPIGRLFDAHGPRRLLLAGTVLYALSIALISIARVYWHFLLAQGVLFGLGVGLQFYPAVASVSTHFSAYRATAIGVALSGSSLGGVVFPLVLQRLFGAVGFAWAVRVAGGVCLANPRSFSDAPFVLLTSGSMFIALGIFVPLIYIVDFAQSQGLGPRTASAVLAALNGGGVLGRLIPPVLADRVGRFNLLAPAALLAGVACVAAGAGARGAAGVVGFAAAYGVASGAFVALVNPCVFGISDARARGARMGVLYSAIAFPSLVGGPVAGALRVRSGGHDFAGTFAFAGAAMMVGSGVVLWAKLRVEPRFFGRV